MGTLFNREELVKARQDWKRAGKTVVFTNGCYDLLHPGHIRLLEQARSLGDVLILALNTDASVQRLKGPSRPVMSEANRAEVALALEAVDAVAFFDEDTPREEVEAAGGKVMALPLEPGYSTTNIVELMLARPL
jgi:cytidyltransferase-like protein